MKAFTLRPFLIMGMTGLTITVVTNLIALVLLKQHPAQYFTSDWWSTWFPSYSVWLTFTIIGLFVRIRTK